MEIKTILWPTDLSENSVRASEAVSYLSRKFDCRVVLLYVGFDLDNYFPAYGETSKGTHDKFEEWEKAEAQKRLDNLCSDKLSGCPLIERMITVGDPVTEILKAIEEKEADLVVMATSGRGGRDMEGICGGVTEKIVRTSPVHVMTVNPKHK